MMLPSLSVSGSVTLRKISFRLRVMKALTVQFEKINPTNGYEHDMRGKVFRGRIRYGDEDDPIPMISILEAPIPQEVNNGSDASTGDWELLIQGFVEDDKENPTDPAHDLMAEAKKILTETKVEYRGTNILGMQNRVFEMNIGQGAVRPPDDASDKAFFWLTLRLKLAEKLDDPYE